MLMPRVGCSSQVNKYSKVVAQASRIAPGNKAALTLKAKVDQIKLMLPIIQVRRGPVRASLCAAPCLDHHDAHIASAAFPTPATEHVCPTHTTPGTVSDRPEKPLAETSVWKPVNVCTFVPGALGGTPGHAPARGRFQDLATEDAIRCPGPGEGGGSGGPRTPTTPPPPPCTWSTARATAPSPAQPTPGVVKQDKSSGGSVDTTKTRSGPQRVRMSGGKRPMGAAKGKQSDTEALCQPPPPPPQGGLRPTVSEGGRPVDRGAWATKTVKRPPQQPARPPIRQRLGAADAQMAPPATFSTAPAHQLLGSANAETTPARAPAAAADRTQRRDATCEGKNGRLSRAP